jgi:hypothetical protein
VAEIQSLIYTNLSKKLVIPYEFCDIAEVEQKISTLTQGDNKIKKVYGSVTVIGKSLRETLEKLIGIPVSRVDLKNFINGKQATIEPKFN